MICPECGAEYIPGFTRCSDCHVDLIEPAPEPEKVPEPKTDFSELAAASPANLVTVLATGDPGPLAVAKSLLQSADIPYMTCGEATQDLFGVGRIGGYNFITGPAELRVRAEDEKDARLLLEDLLENARTEP